MFKHLLLPTDGSKLADRAVQRGIEFAKEIKAQVTAVHVIPEFTMMADESFVLPASADRSAVTTRKRRRARKKCWRDGERAQAAGVKSEGIALMGDRPYEEIIETAKKRKCT